MPLIRLPNPQPGRQVVGGILFTDGVADARPGRNTTAYLRNLGATFGCLPLPRPIKDMTVTDLRDYAAGAGIDVPAKARKAQIIDLIAQAGNEP